MLNILKKILFSKTFEKKRHSVTDVVALTKQNSSEAYSKLWGDNELLTHYLSPSRISGYEFIADYIIHNAYGNKIVELGFGSADFLKTLRDIDLRCNFEIYGLDYAATAVSRAQEIIPDGKFYDGNMYSLPFENDFFDQVFCLQTLEHLQYPELALIEMDRICKINGRILVTVPNGDLDDFEGHVNFWNINAFKDILKPREMLDFIVYNENRTLMAAFHPLKVHK